MDAQVMFSWVLSQSLTSKNIFARNRLKDILQMISRLDLKYKLKPHLKYVATMQNLTNLITRGLTLK